MCGVVLSLSLWCGCVVFMGRVCCVFFVYDVFCLCIDLYWLLLVLLLLYL